jgi:hypothetical protein
VRESGDAGRPLVAAAPDHPVSRELRALARRVADTVMRDARVTAGDLANDR